MDNLYEPMELDILPNGNIIFVQRRGEVIIYDFEAGEGKEVDKLDVFSGLEDGLIMIDIFGCHVEILPVVIAGGAVLLLLGLFQLILGLRAQKAPKATGEKTMIGETGIVSRSSGFRQRTVIEIRGELWWCVHKDGKALEVGDTVEVVGIEKDSMILEVKQVQS